MTTPTTDNQRDMQPLYHMSRTAGVGLQDYKAVNPLAVASVMVGLASTLALLNNLMLLVPLVGVILAVVAIVQIRNSNRTQTGLLLAVLGLVLSGALGGGRVVTNIQASMREADDRAAINTIASQLAGEFAVGNYDAAYQRFSARFRERVPLAEFRATAERQQAIPMIGRIISGDLRDPLVMEYDAEKKQRVANTLMAFAVKPPGGEQALIRESAVFQTVDDKWMILDMPSWFPPPPPMESGAGAPPR